MNSYESHSSASSVLELIILPQTLLDGLIGFDELALSLSITEGTPVADIVRAIILNDPAVFKDALLIEVSLKNQISLNTPADSKNVPVRVHLSNSSYLLLIISLDFELAHFKVFIRSLFHYLQYRRSLQWAQAFPLQSYFLAKFRLMLLGVSPENSIKFFHHALLENWHFPEFELFGHHLNAFFTDRWQLEIIFQVLHQVLECLRVP